eukprot:g4108.t1
MEHELKTRQPNHTSSKPKPREDSVISRTMSYEDSDEKENKQTYKFESSTHLKTCEPNRKTDDFYQLSSALSTSTKYEDYRKTKRMYKLSEFRFIRELGRGKYGQVLLAMDMELDILVAIKRIKTTVGKQLYDQFRSEIEIQGHIQHPNIIKLYGHFIENDTMHLVLECALHGSLYDTLLKHGPLSEAAVSRYIKALANVLGHLHSHDVIHRDIKPENVLLTETGDVKLADFGWSVLSSEVESMTVCGTLDYLSPEMLKYTKHDCRVDIWSLGTLCFELLFGVTPFHDEDCLNTCKRIKEANFSFPSTPVVSENAKHFISSILVRDPDSRLSIDQIERHPFITRAVV